MIDPAAVSATRIYPMFCFGFPPHDPFYICRLSDETKQHSPPLPPCNLDPASRCPEESLVRSSSEKPRPVFHSDIVSRRSNSANMHLSTPVILPPRVKRTFKSCVNESRSFAVCRVVQTVLIERAKHEQDAKYQRNLRIRQTQRTTFRRTCGRSSEKLGE